MKKSKLKSLVKSARKTAKKDIRLSLVAGLKEIAGKYGNGSKKLEKDIKKGSKLLAKVLSKDIKIDKSALQETHSEISSPEIVETEAPALSKKKTAKLTEEAAPVADTETEG